MTQKSNIIVKSISLLLILFCFSNTLQAQPEYWQRQYQSEITGVGSEHIFYDIKIDIKGNYFAGGSRNEFGGFDCAFVAYLNKFGIPIWKKSICQIGIVQKIIIVDSSSCIMGCVYNGSIVCLRIDTLGNIIWQKQYFNTGGTIEQIIRTNDNRFLLCGTNRENPYLLKIDIDGNVNFSKNYEYGFYNTFLGLIHQENYYIVTGATRDKSGFRTDYLRKIDTSGAIINNVNYNLNFNLAGPLKYLFGTDKIFLFGNFMQNQQTQACYIFKYDFSLADSFKVQNTFAERFISAGFYKDNSFVISCDKGTSFTGQAIFKIIDYRGTIKKYNQIIAPVGGGISLLSTSWDGNTSFYGSGLSDYYHENRNFAYTIRLDSVLNTIQSPLGINNQSLFIKDFSLSQNYPNPFNPSTKISYSLKKSSDVKLKLFDVSGRFVKLIQSGFKPAGSYEINFSGEGLSSGVYFISLYADGILADTKKAVLVK